MSTTSPPVPGAFATSLAGLLLTASTGINGTLASGGGGNGTNSTGGTNGTNPLIIHPGAGADAGEGNYVLNTIIGLLIVLVASLINAFGLNLTKLDHIRTEAIPKRERRRVYLRPLWLAGMGMYIISQLFGSTLALRWIRPDWVAPLGSSSLVFNFLFAKWLVGTPVTPTDIRGTVIIVLGVILILVFSSINHGLQQSLSIDRLTSLWVRASWLAYFAFLLAFTTSTYLVSHLLARLLASRASYSPLPSPTIELRPSLPSSPHPVIGFFKRLWAGWMKLENQALGIIEKILQRTDDPRVIWLQGIGWSVAGGSLAGMCLVFTKAVVKLLGNPGHPLVYPAGILTLLLVIGTAVTQIVCLNKALVCADTVVVVPLFYAGYTVFGFINSLIFYNEAGQYATWVLVAVFLSIAVLISGVVLLSLKSSAKTAPDPYNTITTEPEDRNMRLRPRAPKGTADEDDDEEDAAERGEAGPVPGSSSPRRKQNGDALPRDDVLWEVGSDSDSEDGHPKDEDGEEKRLGVGGGNVRGERRGLLVEDDDEGEYADAQNAGETPKGAKSVERSPVPPEVERNPFAEEADESFGDYSSPNLATGSPKADRE